jgi:hypothetical protein
MCVQVTVDTLLKALLDSPHYKTGKPKIKAQLLVAHAITVVIKPQLWYPMISIPVCAFDKAEYRT